MLFFLTNIEIEGIYIELFIFVIFHLFEMWSMWKILQLILQQLYTTDITC